MERLYSVPAPKLSPDYDIKVSFKYSLSKDKKLFFFIDFTDRRLFLNVWWWNNMELKSNKKNISDTFYELLWFWNSPRYPSKDHIVSLFLHRTFNTISSCVMHLSCVFFCVVNIGNKVNGIIIFHNLNSSSRTTTEKNRNRLL